MCVLASEKIRHDIFPFTSRLKIFFRNQVKPASSDSAFWIYGLSKTSDYQTVVRAPGHRVWEKLFVVLSYVRRRQIYIRFFNILQNVISGIKIFSTRNCVNNVLAV